MASLPTVIRIANYIAGHVPEGIWLFEEGPPPVAEYTGTFELRKATMKFARTSPSGIAQDDAMCTFHLVNITGGSPDASWITADYTTAETQLAGLWDDIKSQYGTAITMHEIAWQADGPAFKPYGSSLSPVLRVTPYTKPGTDTTHTQRLPPQVAMSVTERTAAHYTAYGVGVPGSTPGTGRTQVRNRWGRVYLPAMQSYYLDDVGRWRTDVTAAIALAFKTRYAALKAADLVPVMYSPTTGNAWSIDQVSIDDVVDVIRSRRWEFPQNRAVQTI